MIINFILQMGKYVTERLSDLSNNMKHAQWQEKTGTLDPRPGPSSLVYKADL